ASASPTGPAPAMTTAAGEPTASSPTGGRTSRPPPGPARRPAPAEGGRRGPSGPPAAPHRDRHRRGLASRTHAGMVRRDVSPIPTSGSAPPTPGSGLRTPARKCSIPRAALRLHPDPGRAPEEGRRPSGQREVPVHAIAGSPLRRSLADALLLAAAAGAGIGRAGGRSEGRLPNLLAAPNPSGEARTYS